MPAPEHSTTIANQRSEAIEAALPDVVTELRTVLPRSADQCENVSKLIPAGTTRARFWQPFTVYMSSARGAYVTDIDDRRYIDCNLGFGPMILGHAHPEIERTLAAQLPRGVHFGAPCANEGELAARIVANLPGAEKVIFVNSGTEATLAALRIARVATGREKVAKFEGGWHGAQEFLFHSYVSIAGEVEHAATVPDMGGIPKAVTETVAVLPYNHPAAIERIRGEGHELAAVIVEPVQGGGGSLPAHDWFLRDLRAACDEVGALLIMDEVITGFRLGPHSAAGHYGVTGDLTTLGKIIGGGLPVGAVAGRSDLIDLTAPVRSGQRARDAVTVAGTFAGNPMTTAAGVAQLDVLLSDAGAYPLLDRLGDRMRQGLAKVAEELNVAAQVTGVGSMWGLHFTGDVPTNVRDLQSANVQAGRLLAMQLLLEGVLMSSPVHLGFLSTVHTDDDVDRVVEAHRRALERMKALGCV